MISSGCVMALNFLLDALYKSTLVSAFLSVYAESQDQYLFVLSKRGEGKNKGCFKE